jgi:anti-anti-sigma factor
VSTYALEVHEAVVNGAVVAALSGELDLTNAVELEERLDAAASDDSLLVIDLNRVVFIDSAALHVLFKLARRRGDGRLKLLVEPSSSVSRTLDIVGMRHAIPVVSSLDDI